MKAVLTIVIVILFYSCADVEKLNNRIYEAQKLTLLQSPYESAKSNIGYVEALKDFRINELPKLIRNIIYAQGSLKDTILMFESFGAACKCCPSDAMRVLYKDTVYTLKRVIIGKELIGQNEIRFRVETVPFAIALADSNYRLRNSEFIEIVSKIKSKESWTANLLQYSAANCNDGGHSLVTVIYPNKTIEALYVP